MLLLEKKSNLLQVDYCRILELIFTTKIMPNLCTLPHPSNGQHRRNDFFNLAFNQEKQNKTHNQAIYKRVQAEWLRAKRLQTRCLHANRNQAARLQETQLFRLP
jgi:hypothetical protein